MGYAVRDALEEGRETTCWLEFAHATRVPQPSRFLLELSSHRSELDVLARMSRLDEPQGAYLVEFMLPGAEFVRATLLGSELEPADEPGLS